jgi:hypothetical protein
MVGLIMKENYTKNELSNDIDYLVELGFAEKVYDENGNELGIRVTEKGLNESYKLLGRLN